MSKRPPKVKVGDRVRVTTVHTGIITEIDDDGFLLEPHPGRPIRGSFHGDGGEMTWEILRPPELPVGSVVLDSTGLAWQRDGTIVLPWCAASADVEAPDLDWRGLNDERGPLTVIHEAKPC